MGLERSKGGTPRWIGRFAAAFHLREGAMRVTYLYNVLSLKSPTSSSLDQALSDTQAPSSESLDADTY